ncbi:FRG domain-containing protein [Priestia megaterium]|uniref:FRG domain-containing protein n=1 Tax=Priestia megaterium TaxID=1404 RepID=UPI002D7FB063|nr:FRG domain-containing protein [Priestia megaterium]MEB4872111.1 FRG domain-containing protein [Priestia megaterium]
MSENIIEEVYLEDVKELYQQLSPFGKYSHLLRNFIFRGEASAKYKLIPSALREQNKSKLYSFGGIDKPVDNQDEWEQWQQHAEWSAIRKFFILADEGGIVVPDVPFFREDILNSLAIPHFRFDSTHNWLPNELLEIAGLAQHYGVPTRFIDWSSSHNISLYFAAVGAMKKNNISDDYMVLWALNYRYIENKRLTEHEMPLRLIKPTYNRNPNLLAQKGILSCWEYNCHLGVDALYNFANDGSAILVDRTPLDELLEKNILERGIPLDNEGPLMYKFYIPSSQCHTLYKSLVELNFGADSLFPGLNGVVQRMEDDTYFNKK